MKHKEKTNCQHLDHRFLRRNYIISFLMLFSLSLTAQNSIENSCLECHKELVSKEFVHGPTAADCAACHEPTGAEHSNAITTGGFTLFATGSQMCYECHTELPEEHQLRYVHEPLEKGECMACHDIHSADNSKLLISQSPDLCLSCHEEFVAEKAEATNIHTASFEGDACMQCHTPHASKVKRLLAGKSKDLCLECHNKIIKRKDETLIANIGKHIENSSHIHKALNKRCTSCHNAHYSTRPLLLKENFTIGSYAKGVEDSFLLCFECHDTDLLNLEKTDAYTQFREGDRNLHYVHVNKEKGRNCSTCHDLHAANNTQLIAKTVKFGRWDMPLNYIPNDDGGTCATGCHKERSYARGAAVESEE